MLDILINPNPLLRQRAAELKDGDLKNSRLLDLIADMSETMLAKDGVGLAAPQIGDSRRLIVVNTRDGILAMINPVITARSLTKEWDEEGCLSIPNTFGQVKRHKKIRCQFLTAAGKNKKIEAKGLLARVIQHEIDHLDGILFIDKAKNIHEAREL